MCVKNVWKICPGMAFKNLSKTQHFCTTSFSHVFHTIFKPFFTRSSVLQFHVYAQVFTPYVRYFNAHLCFGLVFHAHILNIVSHMHFGHVFTPIFLATLSHSFTLTWRSRLDLFSGSLLSSLADCRTPEESWLVMEKSLVTWVGADDR